jgi:uncharacterized membrane protein HdeD (DUF308 family)
MSMGSTTGMVNRSSGQWGWVAASGVLGLVLGVVALFFPAAALIYVAIVLGIGLIVQGIMEIAAAIRGGTGTTGRGWLIAFGVLALVAGIIVLTSPGTGIIVLAWGLTLWFFIVGIHDLIVAFSTREHRGWNIALGVISIVAALILLFSPGTAVGVIALFVALGFLFRGGADLGLALQMRRAARP